MKRFVCSILITWISFSSFAQPVLCLSTDKTTSLVFPTAIKHVDRGTQSVLAQQVKDAPAILFVKAGVKDFLETNLSVVTEDGSLYTFRVCYDAEPTSWVFQVPIQGKETVAATAAALADNSRFIWRIRDKRWGIKAAIAGIYIKDDVMYFQLELANESPINYDIELLRFYIADKKKSQRTSVQEIELKPLHIHGNTTIVSAGSKSTLVVALDKFTVPDGKAFGVQLLEKKGGRHLNFKVANRWFMRAKRLN